MPSYQDNARKKLIAAVICVMILAGLVVAADKLKGTAASSDSTALSTPPGATGPSTGSYKDGTYSATSTYYVPHGSESIQVTLTVKNGTITDAAIANSESDRESAEYQHVFASLYKGSVVGKPLSGFNLDVVAGASDTTDGFNQTVSQIANQAQA
jgi:uncharacterized protein with FMN-binding domain